MEKLKSTDDIHANSLFVIKRDRRQQPAMVHKITSRISKLSVGLDLKHADLAGFATEIFSYLH
ncbi:unnamed protein product, partial [Rotaria sordida]